MKKKILGIIGFPLGHSYSPKLHNYWNKKNNLNIKYKKFATRKRELKKIINRLRTKEIYGLNVTIPHKTEIIKYLDELRGDAKITRSVNTIVTKKNKLIGENTDVYGFEFGFLKKIKKNKKKKVLILGAGGVVPSVIYALKKNKIRNITICHRSKKRIDYIKRIFRKKFSIIKWKERNNFLSKNDIVINATSLGMKTKKNLDLNINLFKSNSVYFDLVYNPLNTSMIKKLKKKNINTLDGLDMFIKQAEKSFFLWHKKKIYLNSSEKRKIFKNLYD